MKHIIDAHEKNLLPPDTPLNDKTLTGSFAVINLAIQDPKLKTRKSETYDKIGLNTGIYGPVSDEEKVIKNDPKPKQVIKNDPKPKQVVKPQPPQQVKPKPIPPKPKEKPVNVVFRTNISPKEKKRIESVTNTKKAHVLKPLPKPKEPLLEKRVILPDKKRLSKVDIVAPKTTSFNKLYDV